MGRFNHAQNGFDAGELSPKLWARTDLELYKRGARELRNFYASVEGPAMKRPGSQFIKATTGGGAARLIPFIYSQDQTYVVELTNGAIRVIPTSTAPNYSALSSATSITPSTSGSIPSDTFTTAQLKKVQYFQSADTLYLLHPDVAPQVIQRTSVSTFTHKRYNGDVISGLTDAHKSVPYLPVNATGITLSAAATTGTNIVVTASSDLFVAGHVGAFFTMLDGAFRVISVTNATTARVDITNDLTATTATAVWYESAWSTYRGFPRAGCFFEDRLVFGGNATLPDTIWWSKPADYDYFSPAGTTSDDPFSKTLSSRQVNQIQWMVPQQVLVVGTLGGEWRIARADVQAGFSFNNSEGRQQTDHGSVYVQAHGANGASLFCSKDGVNIREFLFNFESDAYVAENLSVGAEHLMSSPINEMAWDNRYAILWCLAGTTLIALTRDRSQKVRAWSKHVFGGSLSSGDPSVLSVCTVPYDNGTTISNQVWVCVSRTINSSTVYYIERIRMEDDRFVDSHIPHVYADLGGVFSLGSFTHLEGQTVKVVVDGAVGADCTVASAAVSPQETASASYIIGLGFTARLRSLRPDPPTAIGSSQGLVFNADHAVIRFHKSKYAKVGSDADDTELVNFEAATMDTAPEEFSGDKLVPLQMSPEIDNSLYVVSDQPLATHVAGFFLRGQVSDA